MTTSKLTVTVPDDIKAGARRASGGNLSAYVRAALREKLLREAMAEYADFRARSNDDLDDIYAP
jgi:post-segregation antitoxin (ccd killing protein)